MWLPAAVLGSEALAVRLGGSPTQDRRPASLTGVRGHDPPTLERRGHFVAIVIIISHNNSIY